MPDLPGPLRGHGTSSNPPNRFEPIALELDGDTLDHEGKLPDPRTVYFRDSSRTALTTNQSPDVPFETSLNPYRGCVHGCVYCLAPDSPVLHADFVSRPVGDVRTGDVLLGFDEQPVRGRARRLRRSMVLAVWWSRRPTVRVITQGTQVETTLSHRWLAARPGRWLRTEQLRPGHTLRHLRTSSAEPFDDDYAAGYVSGLSLGDGTRRYEPGWRSDKLGFPAAYWRVAMIDVEPLERLVTFLRRFGVKAAIRPFDPGAGRPFLQKVEIRSLSRLEIVCKLCDVERASRSWRRGFVAGFFDAEGHNGSSLRVSQKDTRVLERVAAYTASLGFHFQLERRPAVASTLRLVGPVAERIRFFGCVRPAIRRKRERLFGWALRAAADPIVAVEPGPVGDVVDIQTTTGTFFASGLATHNCYARPTHEYFGLSAGLDFETKIFVKEDAPELLRAELARPGWKPQVIAVSGVTDAYQPIERRTRLTRRCLEVLAEFRNPVGVITKSQLVVRDADLLGELARYDAAAVTLSITTLDPDLARVLEPRAAQPKARLAAIEALARAGIPVGVNVAPVIPALNDHEIPAIVAAAADAGARWAGCIVVRLPHGVAELFERWLEDHYPARKARVLSRIRAVRAGRLNDPTFGSRMRGTGLFAQQIQELMRLARRRAGLGERGPELSAAAFRRAGHAQLALF